jgi:hypothetical protein
VVGKVTPRLLKSGTRNPQEYELFWETILNKQVVKREMVNKTKNGRLVVVDISVNPIFDERGARISRYSA